MSGPQRYSVVVAKDYLKFSAAHFIAYPGFREPLHGHNYQVSVRIDAELGPYAERDTESDDEGEHDHNQERRDAPPFVGAGDGSPFCPCSGQRDHHQRDCQDQPESVDELRVT